MLALMPRFSACVLCGEPIQGQGRIDRIYCSASCRTLAWRARSGDRWAARRKGRAPQPGSFVARESLPLLAVRMRAELEAAKRRVAELEDQLDDDASSPLMASAGVVAVGAVGLLVALQKRLGRKHRAVLAQLRAQFEAEETHRRAEMAAMREQAARRQDELEKERAEYQRWAERAERDRQVAASAISNLERNVEELRHQHRKDAEQLSANEAEMARLRERVIGLRAQSQARQAALLDESRQREKIQGQLVATERKLSLVQTEWQTAYGQLGASRQAQIQQLSADCSNWETAYKRLKAVAQKQIGQLSADCSNWQTAYKQLEAEAQQRIRQLTADCSNWQTAHAQLQADAQKLIRQLNSDARQHRMQLAALNSRLELAENTFGTFQFEAPRPARTHRAQLEQIHMAATRSELPGRRQRRQKQATLTSKKEPKELPAKKKKARKKLPPKRSTVEKILIGAAGTAVGAVAAIAGKNLIGKAGRKTLPPKEEGTHFEVTRVGGRKQLPPKRD